MKKILLTYNDIPSVNLGDYIQSLAAKQFFDDDNYSLYNRDELNMYRGAPSKLILNAWFTYKPKNFPPSECIIPLFLSFHLNSVFGEDILKNRESLNYLKENEPIGCRDRGTVNLLESFGISAYFSSCLTTTLALKYKKEKSLRDKIYIVDPLSYMPEGNGLYEVVKTCLLYIKKFRSINKLIVNYRKNNPFKIKLNKIGLGRILLATHSYYLLRNVISDEILEEAIFITHYHMQQEIKSDVDRFKRAEELLGLYSKANLVITSRIHCALPCLSFGTPVIYLLNDNEKEKSSCRLDGILDFFNIIRYNSSLVSR